MTSEGTQLLQYSKKRKRTDSPTQPQPIIQTTTVANGPIVATTLTSSGQQPISPLDILKGHVKTIKDEMKELGEILNGGMSKGACEWLKQELKSVKTTLMDLEEKVLIRQQQLQQ